MDFTKYPMTQVVTALKKKLPPYELPTVIENMADYTLAVELGSKISKATKDVESMRDHFSKPHYATYKNIREQFEPFIEVLESKAKLLKPLMIAFNVEEQKRRDAEQLRLEQEALSKVSEGEEVVVAVIDSVKTVESATGKAQMRALKKWRVSDFGSVPIEFLMVDTKLVDESIKKGIIPSGIETYIENSMAFQR